MRRTDEREGQGKRTGEVRKEVAGGRSKVTSSADAGVDSAERSHFRCDARLEGQPQPRKVDTAPLKFGQRDGRPTSAGPRQKLGEENSRAQWDGVAGRKDGASLYEKWGAYFDARSRVKVENRKATERKEAPSGGASFLGTGPADVGAKVKKWKDGASPQKLREASVQSVVSESNKNTEVKLDQKGRDNEQGGRQERAEYIIRGPLRCQKAGCTRRAYYGYHSGSRRLVPKWCGEHKKSDMARRYDNVCKVEECFTSAHCAFPGEKGRSRCAQHKEKGMIRVGFTCEVEGCLTIATFRRSLKESKSIRCSAHKKDGMVPRSCCKMDGCTSYACYGCAGTGRWTSCKKHKENGMVYRPHKKRDRLPGLA